MSRQHKFARTSVPLRIRVAACCATAVVTAGCGAGQLTQTDSQVAAIDGATADVGSIALRDVQLSYPEGMPTGYPAGADVPLQLTIVNQGNTAEVLESVSTPMARQVLLQGASTIPAERSVATPEEARTDVAPGDAGHGAATAPVDASLSPLDFGEIRIMLVDLTGPLRPGLNAEITFVFRDAGPVTLPVPMAPPTDSERRPLSTSTDGH